MNDILKDLVDVNQFAADVHKHPRTIFRWIELEDGLPVIKLGKQRLIHVPTARMDHVAHAAAEIPVVGGGKRPVRPPHDQGAPPESPPLDERNQRVAENRSRSRAAAPRAQSAPPGRG